MKTVNITQAKNGYIVQLAGKYSGNEVVVAQNLAQVKKILNAHFEDEAEQAVQEAEEVAEQIAQEAIAKSSKGSVKPK